MKWFSSGDEVHLQWYREEGVGGGIDQSTNNCAKEIPLEKKKKMKSEVL